MTFVSYAQNFEDVLLWRALKHVQNGRYIDIGAWEPELDSVSKAFYDKGWRGVHVEPVPFYAEKLRQARPDEVVVEAAIGLGRDTVELTVIAETGLSTGKAEIADLHRALPFRQAMIIVPKVPLSELFDVHALDDVHWLKIDVEGMEEEVLQSWQGHPARPWVLVLESTLPNEAKQNHYVWESEVLARGYHFVYFDGLNRFYVHESHLELRSVFGPGPNFFDDYILATTASQAETIGALRHEREHLASQLQQLASQLQQLTSQLQQSEAVATRAKETIEVMENSFAWRSTALLRYFFKHKP